MLAAHHRFPMGRTYSETRPKSSNAHDVRVVLNPVTIYWLCCHPERSVRKHAQSRDPYRHTPLSAVLSRTLRSANAATTARNTPNQAEGR